MIKRYLRLMFLSLLLCSCATQMPPSASLQTHPNHWQADGVFAYRDAKQGFSAGYIWKNTDQHYDINIIGPLGAWRAVLQGNATEANLSTSDGKIHKNGQPEILMQQNLGWSIPVEDLMHWLWAMPNPHQPGLISKNVKNQVVAIQQNGWVIHYSNYDDFEGRLVPNRIILSQNDKKITVVIQHRSV